MKLDNDLRHCRLDRGGMSQENLASAVGVTRQTILSIEKGKYIPSALLALKLAVFFNKPVEEIFYIVDEEKSEGEKK